MPRSGSASEQDPQLAALAEVLEANRALQDALRESEGRIVRYIAELEGGRSTSDMVRVTPASTVRIGDNDAFDRLTRARRRSRAATFRRLIDEGMSRKEIAEHWGFSQQVVSQILKHELPPGEQPPAGSSDRTPSMTKPRS
jgi:hypothetical protein